MGVASVDARASPFKAMLPQPRATAYPTTTSKWSESRCCQYPGQVGMEDGITSRGGTAPMTLSATLLLLRYLLELMWEFLLLRVHCACMCSFT